MAAVRSRAASWLLSCAALLLSSRLCAGSDAACQADTAACWLDDANSLMQVSMNLETPSCKTDYTGYEKYCDPDKPSEAVSFAGDHCAFFIRGFDSCNQFCYQNGKRKCYAAASTNGGGCAWREDQAGAGTADMCNVKMIREMCVCSEEVVEGTTEPPDVCATRFGNDIKEVCDQDVMTWANGNCAVLVRTENFDGGNCDGFCAKHGLECLAAADNKNGCAGWKNEDGATTKAYCTVQQKRQICVCSLPIEPTPAATPSPTGESWCYKPWTSNDFSKCDYWGDPHFKKSFGPLQKYDLMGLGAYLAAGSKSDDFEVQNFQCSYGKKPANALAVGMAARFKDDIVVVSQDKSLVNKIWINGVESSFSDLNTIGLKTFGTFTAPFKTDGLQVMTSDCKYRWMAAKRPMGVYPGYSIGSMIRIPKDDTKKDGMCQGCEYHKNVGKKDLLFTSEQIELFCSHCLIKPDICNNPAPPTPAPVEDACDDPLPPCEDPDNSPGCGMPAAVEACKALIDADQACYEGCIFDFCAGDCKGPDATEEDCITEPPDPPTPAPTPLQVTVSGDPHVTNVDGQRFQLARLGVHEFLRLPRRGKSTNGSAAPKALLEVRGSVETDEPCAEPFVQEVDMDGLWLREVGPLAFRAGGRARDSKDAITLRVNGSRVFLQDLSSNARLRKVLEATVPKPSAKPFKKPMKILREQMLVVKVRFPKATLKVEWIHREVPGSQLNHLNFHVTDLPKPQGRPGMDIGGILGHDGHTFASTPNSDCLPSVSLLSRGKGDAAMADVSSVSASYAEV